MSLQKNKSSAGRRSASTVAGPKSGRKPSSSADRPKLEPLPEIVDSSNSDAAVPATTSSAAVSHSSSHRTQGSELDATSYPGSSLSSMQVADPNAMHADTLLCDASIRTSTASSDHHPLLPAAETTSTDNMSSMNHQPQQRPRSRTASPWRGKPRTSANIFSRPKANNASRQSTTDTQLALKHDAVGGSLQGASAISGSDGSVASSGMSSAGLALERSSTIAGDRPDQYASAQQRRRGHTMDPDRFGARQISTSTGTEPAVTAGSGTHQAPSGTQQQQQPALASHFHVSLNNTALAVRTDRRVPQPAQPTRLAKNDSGSSNNTVTTAELDASASSTHSGEALDVTAPRGQLSKMLYNNDLGEAGIGSSELPPLSTQPQGVFGRSGTATSGLSPAGVLGRAKRGGSGGDSRLGDYKGALMRPSTMNIFTTRTRNNTGDQQGSSGGNYDDQDLRGSVAHSGSAETSGVHMSSSAEHIISHTRLGQPMRTGLSSGDDLGEDMRSATTFSHASSSRETVASGGQQPRAVPTQGSVPKGDWVYMSPGERLGADGAADVPGHRPLQHPAALRAARGSAVSPQHDFSEAKDLPMANSSDSIASTTLHHRRESGKVGRTQAGIVPRPHGRSDAMARVPSDVSAHLTGTGTYSSNGSGTRLPGGADSALFGGEDSDAWQYSRDANGLLHHGRGDDYAASSQPCNPWTLAPPRSHKKMLRYDFPEACNAIAVAPYNEPTCAVVSNESLFLLSMDPDKIVLRNSLAINRRRSAAPSYSDVVWRPMDHLVTGTKNGKVTVWDPSRSGDHIVRTYSGDVAREIKRLAIKPGDTEFVYGALSDGQILGWDFRSTSNTPSLRIPAPFLTQDIDTNPLDANMIAAVVQESRLCIWDIRKSAQPLAIIGAHPSSAVVCVAWHPSGRFIGTGGSDQTIRIFDFNVICLKKTTTSPFCTIKTISTPRRLQWRPGHETQISSCATTVDPRFQVWDMRNPNHSLCFHDRHTDRITGFTWYDENLVWTAGRDKAVLQCDIQSEAVYTEGLLGYSAIDLGMSTHLAVATGLKRPDCAPSNAPASLSQLAAATMRPVSPAKKHPSSSGSSRGKTKRVTSGGSRDGDGGDAGALVPASVAENEYQHLAFLGPFLLNLPVPYVDEHPLGTELAVNATAICNLARGYRYDPNAFTECCENNSREARANGLLDIAKFWTFLSAVFGDALPLKSKRKPASIAALAAEAEAAAAVRASPEPLNEPRRAESASSGAGQRPYSVATSRSSSGMYASRSVSASYPVDDVANDSEVFSRYPDLSVLSLTVQNTPSLAGNNNAEEEPAESQSQPRPAVSGANNDDSARIQRNHTSHSHSNLQHAVVPPKLGGVPSPRLHSAGYLMSSPPVNYVSEPTTPATRPGPSRLPRNYTTGANLSLAGSQRAALDPSDTAEPRGNQEVLLSEFSKRFFLHDSATPTTEQHTPVLSSPSLPTPPTPQPALLPALAPIPSASSKLGLGGELLVTSGTPTPPSPQPQAKPPRHITKAELTMAARSCEYYVDMGDVQTAVTAALLLRNFIHLPNWHATEHWFQAYILQLDSYEEYTAATEILLAAPFDAVHDPITVQTTMCISCSHCKSQLAVIPPFGMAWCTFCQRMATSCAVCELPVKGEFIWCHVCGHGGHAHHIRGWFEEQKQSSCPSGCGHICQPLITRYSQKYK
ncbi:SEA (Seh1-associated) complex subunit [Coemansia sp. BCRC 34301]|nr:SEA (Seh1-associated) complex subunit [Coemansia sp. BCRC 34301]